ALPLGATLPLAAVGVLPPISRPGSSSTALPPLSAPPAAGAASEPAGLQPIPALSDYDESDDAPTRVVDAASLRPGGDAGVGDPQQGLPPVPLAPRAPSFSVQEQPGQQGPSLAPVAYAEQVGTLPPAAPARSRGLGAAVWIGGGALALAAA